MNAREIAIAAYQRECRFHKSWPAWNDDPSKARFAHEWVTVATPGAQEVLDTWQGRKVKALREKVIKGAISAAGKWLRKRNTPRRQVVAVPFDPTDTPDDPRADADVHVRDGARINAADVPIADPDRGIGGGAFGRFTWGDPSAEEDDSVHAGATPVPMDRDGEGESGKRTESRAAGRTRAPTTGTAFRNPGAVQDTPTPAQQDLPTGDYTRAGKERPGTDGKTAAQAAEAKIRAMLATPEIRGVSSRTGFHPQGRMRAALPCEEIVKHLPGGGVLSIGGRYMLEKVRRVNMWRAAHSAFNSGIPGMLVWSPERSDQFMALLDVPIIVRR